MSFVIIASSSNGPTVKKAELTDWMDTIAAAGSRAINSRSEMAFYFCSLSLFLSLNRR